MDKYLKAIEGLDPEQKDDLLAEIIRELSEQGELELLDDEVLDNIRMIFEDQGVEWLEFVPDGE